MKKEIKMVLIISIAIVIFSLVNYKTKLDVIKIQNQEKAAESLREEKSLQDKKFMLSVCLRGVESDFWETWKLNCTSNFKKDDKGEIESCNVPSNLARDIKLDEQKDKDRCVELYK